MVPPLIISVVIIISNVRLQCRVLRMASGRSAVLIHGGRQGGWSWVRVTPLLRSAGWDVYAPTLSGLADRAHLLTPAIDLATHVEDVRVLLEYQDLHDAVLVGHSYGGMVITALCETDVLPRIAGLVYLDALIPRPGDSAYDLMAPEITASRSSHSTVSNGSTPWRVKKRSTSRPGRSSLMTRLDVRGRCSPWVCPGPTAADFTSI